MKKINCVVADDEALAREIIEGYISKLDNLQLVASCADGIDVYNTLRKTPVDLLFLDIRMPHLSGIELLKTLQNPPVVIFTTAYKEYAVESYELGVVDYLVKPISFERFLKALDKYSAIKLPLTSVIESTVQQESWNQAFMYVKSEKKMARILLKDILYIEGLKDYVKIHLNGRAIVTYHTLSYFEEKLPIGKFIRVHRSFIVAASHVTAFSANQIEIGADTLPIGVTYTKKVLGILAG
jgi:DNA-binding LytR/AlgR family response regulator